MTERKAGMTERTIMYKPLPNPSDKSEQVLLGNERGLVVLVAYFTKCFSLLFRENRGVASSLMPKHNKQRSIDAHRAERVNYNLVFCLSSNCLRYNETGVNPFLFKPSQVPSGRSFNLPVTLVAVTPMA